MISAQCTAPELFTDLARAFDVNAPVPVLGSLIAAISIALSIGACSAQEHLPQSPTAAPSAPATVSVQAVTAFRESLSSDTDAYHVAFQLREIGGSTGATVKAIELAFSNGVTGSFGPEFAATPRIRPGATVPVSEMTMTGTRASRAGSVQIRVLVTDDTGVDGVSAAAASVTATYRLSGRITDATTSRPVPGAVVTVTFGAASGRSATSDGTGHYVLNQIPVGSVAFNVRAAGYSTVTRTANIDGDAAIDVPLARAQ